MSVAIDAGLIAEMTAWRRDLHAHPEFGFEEKRTSAFVASKLREFGFDEVVEGVGGTGVVGPRVAAGVQRDRGTERSEMEQVHG